jgi:hypothetical protein
MLRKCNKRGTMDGSILHIDMEKINTKYLIDNPTSSKAWQCIGTVATDD